jgi:hypothetical protein
LVSRNAAGKISVNQANYSAEEKGIPITMRATTKITALGTTEEKEKIFPIHDPVPATATADGIPTLLIKSYRCNNLVSKTEFGSNPSFSTVLPLPGTPPPGTEPSLVLCNKLVINSSDSECGIGKKHFFYASTPSMICTCCKKDIDYDDMDDS